MKSFIIYIIITFLSYIILLEGTTRIFDLSGHTIPETNLNNNKLATPNSEGIWIGGGMREISSHYKINQQGFNSLKDYSILDKNKISIAIIGDSYIESFHVDVENSIGRILEIETKNAIEVHEYGKSGGNIIDFSLMFNKWIKNKYDYTFILATDRDLVANKGSFMGKGNSIPHQSTIRKIYNNSSFIRYLNINHKLSYIINKKFSFSGDSKDKRKNVKSNEINTSALKGFDSKCIILYEKEKLDTTLIAPFKIPCVEVVPEYTPTNYAFDSHWNLNGRKNCALAIKNYIEKKSDVLLIPNVNNQQLGMYFKMKRYLKLHL